MIDPDPVSENFAFQSSKEFSVQPRKANNKAMVERKIRNTHTHTSPKKSAQASYYICVQIYVCNNKNNPGNYTLVNCHTFECTAKYNMKKQMVVAHYVGGGKDDGCKLSGAFFKFYFIHNLCLT